MMRRERSRAYLTRHNAVLAARHNIMCWFSALTQIQPAGQITQNLSSPFVKNFVLLF
jgi:hypothetical protein